MKNHGGWQQSDQIGQQHWPVPHHLTVEGPECDAGGEQAIHPQGNGAGVATPQGLNRLGEQLTVLSEAAR